MNDQFNQLKFAKKIQVYETSSNLIIIRKWLDIEIIFWIILTIIASVSFFTLLFISFIYIDNIKMTLEVTNVSLIFLLLDNIVLLLIFILSFLLYTFIIYNLIAKWINRTYIFANNKEIIIRYEPLPCPWLGNQTIQTVDLERLYSVRRKSIRKMMRRGSPNFSYEIHAITHTGLDKKLVVFSNEKEVWYVEQILENYFHIEDKPKRGEIGGPN